MTRPAAAQGAGACEHAGFVRRGTRSSLAHTSVPRARRLDKAVQWACRLQLELLHVK
jgi:hypothetical protein